MQTAKDYREYLKKEDRLWFEDKDKKFVMLFEKPSQIKAINSVLPAKETKHIKNISLAGHTMRLKNFDEYDPSLKDKTWYKMVKDKNIPFIPEKYEMVIKEKATGKFRTDYQEMVLSAKRAFDQADYIVLAMDPDNEGCALGMEVIEYAKAKDKVIGMINMSKLDYFSLKEEIKELDKIPYKSMAEAGFARSEFDWLFGLNHTILSSVLLGQGQTFHVGGVKSPTIRMVVDRMNEIEKFKPQKYWHFQGEAKHIPTGQNFNYIIKVNVDTSEADKIDNEITRIELEIETIKGLDNNDSNKSKIQELYTELSKLRWKLTELKKEIATSERDIFSKELRQQIEQNIKVGMKFSVTEFTKNFNLTQNAPLAYSLTDLQAEAGTMYNFTPAKTLQLAQKLYEKQVQSYPRTDNRYYAQGEMSNIKKIIPNLLALNKFQNVNIPTPYKAKTGVFNSAKVTAHTGLTPTTKAIDSNTLSSDEQSIYDMVATRYLIQFMDKFEYYKVQLNANITTEIYLTTHQNIETKKGWRELYDPKNYYGFNYTTTQTLPDMMVGDQIEILTIKREVLETKPKPIFTEFSLLKAMENISRVYPELEGLEKGIGTPATRAAILADLFKSKYLIKKGKIIIPSEKAKSLITLLPDNMTSPQLRANMENKLNEIVDGNLTRSEYEIEIANLITQQAKELYKIGKTNNIKVIDKATLPPSEAQLKFAETISKELKIQIPDEAKKLKDEMTKWIKKYEKQIAIKLSEKQYNFIKEYGSDSEEMVTILKANDDGTLTKDQKFKAGKWLGSYMRTSEYQKKRAKKAAETRKKNREAKMKAMGIEVPKVIVKHKKKKES